MRFPFKLDCFNETQKTYYLSETLTIMTHKSTLILSNMS